MLDANVLASFLVAVSRGDVSGTIRRLVRAGLADAYALRLPPALATELLRVLTTVPYFVARIDADDARAFVSALREAAEELPSLITTPPALSRDPNDDDLLAHASVGRADYLVTGGKDLLALAGGDFPFRIVPPSTFLAVLEDAGLA